MAAQSIIFRDTIRCPNPVCNRLIEHSGLQEPVAPGGRIYCPGCKKLLVEVKCPACRAPMKKGIGRVTGKPHWRCSKWPECKRIGWL